MVEASRNERYDLGLMSELIRIFDNEPQSEPDAILARFFLENYGEIGKLNIYDLADECFVSRSSVRRFCQKLGFENFKAFKEDFARTDYSYKYFTTLNTKQDFSSYMLGELAKMIIEMRDVTNDTLDGVADAIHDAHEVILVSSYHYEPILMEFQRPLVLAGKLTRLMHDRDLDRDYLRSLGREDMVILVSVMGSLARQSREDVSGITARKMLITASRAEGVGDGYDYVYFMSREDYSNIKSVYTKYGLPLYFDLLASRYMLKFGPRPLAQ